MMQSTMQDFPLTVGMIFRHGRTVHGESQVVTFEGEEQPSHRRSPRSPTGPSVLAAALAPARDRAG